MSTHRKPIRITGPDGTCVPTLIADQITAAAAPSVGNIPAWKMVPGSDNGVYVCFAVPKDYVGTPKIAVRGVLNGAVSATHTLGFAFRKRANADNEPADGSFDAEQTVSSTIGSTGGSSHSDEDFLESLVALTAGDYAVDDEVFGYLYWDHSGSTYTGNFLLTSLLLEYTDA